MTQNSADIATVEQLLLPICREQSLAVVAVTHGTEEDGPVLRVLLEPEAAVDQPEGSSSVTLEQCSKVSRELSAVLDADDTLVPGAYRLEVSSPGLERPLVKEADYVRFAGREVSLQTRVPVDGRKQYSSAKVLGTEENSVRLEVDGQIIAIPINDISKANLVYKF